MSTRHVGLRSSGRRAFTILELMIVVAIAAVIASMAIPSLLNSRKASNQASAIGSIRAVVSACESYRTRFGSYPTGFSSLETEGYLDSSFEGGNSLRSRRGYNFNYFYGALTGGYMVMATPTESGVSGASHYVYNMNSSLKASFSMSVILRWDPSIAGGWSPID
ncbi:MAG: prepilin-type N-terminal cleavage/methylation domain-containing protein [Planctomycetota bacterium]